MEPLDWGKEFQSGISYVLSRIAPSWPNRPSKAPSSHLPDSPLRPPELGRLSPELGTVGARSSGHGAWDVAVPEPGPSVPEARAVGARSSEPSGQLCQVTGLSGERVEEVRKTSAGVLDLGLDLVLVGVGLVVSEPVHRPAACAATRCIVWYGTQALTTNRRHGVLLVCRSMSVGRCLSIVL